MIVATNTYTGHTYQWPTLGALKRWMARDTTITPQPVTPRATDGGVHYTPCPNTPPPDDMQRVDNWLIIPTMRGYVCHDNHVRLLRHGRDATPTAIVNVSVRLEDQHGRLTYDTFNSALYKAQESVATRAILTDGDGFRVLCERGGRFGWWRATAGGGVEDDEHGGAWSRDAVYGSEWWPDRGGPVEGQTVAWLVAGVNVRAETVAYVVVS